MTSPDGKFDAVIVTRPDTGPPHHLTADPTDLYLLPQGRLPEREPAFPPYPSSLNRTREHREQIPFHSYEAKDVVVKWKDDSTVLLGAKEASVYKMEDSHEVVSGETKRLIGIQYFIEWDSFARKAGPKFPE